ncbi:ATP-binding protein [Microbacterium hydrothermale]|uniref:ATP-binding protein n=1 Tax=Microbacterium hydrothermale TaxID=857427 RepID=UPI0010A90C76|nr:ATP-binding protein [Microbacterium hydrothermale]
MTRERPPLTRDPDHLDLDALGASIRVDLSASAPGDRERIARAWSGATREDDSSPVAVVRPDPSLPFDEAAAALSTRVTLAALAARRGDLWMVHAAAVADDEGRVVLFSGRSGMGKTTLMSHLARDYAYVSDESVGVAADGRVLPYRKPLSIIDRTDSAKRQASPRSLGLRDLPTTASLRLHAIVVLDRDPLCTAPRVEELEITDAISAIAPQCSYLAELAHPLATLTGHVSAVGGALRLRYREASEVVPLVAGLLASHRPRSPLPVAAQHVGSPRDPAGYVRTPVVDAVTIGGDRLALLRRGPHDETAIHLVDGIGPALWRAADGASFDELLSAVIEEHGRPPHSDARAAVRTAVTALCDAGLMTAPAPETPSRAEP